MGIFDFLTGIKRPSAGTPVLALDQTKQAILNLNRETSPFQVADSQAEGADFVAEWKIVDAKWYEIFAKAGIKKVFKIYLKLHPESNEVHALDEEYEVEWQAGIPHLSLSVKKFSGQTYSYESDTTYAFTEELQPGQVYSYNFSTDEIKKPLQTAILGCGWIYKGVTSKGAL